MSSEVMSQSQLLRKNTAAVMDIERRATEARTLQGKLADHITDFTGSMAFVYVHTIWFGFWLLLNVGLIHIPHVTEFDPFPFSLLTLIVSLEAIFLSTFVLISQNRLACASERRAELDLQVNLLAEQKATKVLEMLDEIAKQMDGMSSRFNFRPDPEIQALKVSPEPEEVLEVIEETSNKGAEEVKKEVGKAVEDITGEIKIVRDDVERTSGQLQKVASDVEQIKEEIKAKEMTGEHQRLSLR